MRGAFLGAVAQRADCASKSDAARKFIGSGRVQAHHRALALAESAVGWIEQSTAAQRDHRTGHIDRSQHRRLDLAEIRFAFSFEHLGDRTGFALHDKLVKIDERPPGFLRQLSAQRGLARGRRSVQIKHIHAIPHILRCSRAWATSIDNPFSTRQPAARARCISSVSAGA